MEYPTYFIDNDFINFRDYLLKKNPNIKLYKKGSYINNPLQHNKYLYFIIDGIAIDMIVYKNGYERSLIIHGNNTIIPLYSPTNSPIEKQLIFKAITDCHVIAFTREDFSTLLQSNKELNNEMYISYLKHTNFLLYQDLNHSVNNGITRISIFLLSFLKQLKPINNTIPLSQKQIGSFVGLNLINTSRNLKLLKDMNIINTGRNKIVILDLNKLINLCESSNNII